MMRFAVRQKTGLTRPITCRVTTVAFCLTLALASLLASRLEARSHAAEPPPPHIPIVHATTLSGDAVDLPQALNGKTGILILGFSQHSRDQVTPWGKRLAADYLAAPDILYFEMPILAAVPRLLRPMVLHSLKSSVPDRAQPHFLPVTENESQWRTIAHLHGGPRRRCLPPDRRSGRARPLADPGHPHRRHLRNPQASGRHTTQPYLSGKPQADTSLANPQPPASKCYREDSG